MLTLFIILTLLVTTNNIGWYDDIVIQQIRNITDFKTNIFKIITSFGDWFILLPFSLISILLIKNKKYGIYITFNLMLATIINIILKLIFIRERPLDGIITETGFSYPSGHSFASFAFYGFLAYLIIKSNLKQKTKYILTILLIILILLIGISRVYLGVHFPSDILGGFLGGAIYLLIYIEIIKKIEGVKNEKEKQRKEKK